MKLLIVTQKVDKNDSVLGFFHRWIEEFAHHCEKVTVICLEKGNFAFSSNVSVVSLGKEEGGTKLRYLFQFYKYIFQKRNEYDAVFVHMNPEYVILAGWFWILWNKSVCLWYVHRQVNLKLKIAEKFVRYIFTATQKSFGLKSKKIVSLGHGIDTEYFIPNFSSKKNEKFTIVSVGRITRIKKLEDIIVSMKYLSAEMREKVRVQLIGSPVNIDDKKYKEELRTIIKKEQLESVIEFKGAVPFQKLQEIYVTADLCMNLAPIGGIDKTVLESLSCGIPTLFRNEAFFAILKDFSDRLFFSDTRELADKIVLFVEKKENIPQVSLHTIIKERHDIKQLIRNIIKHYG